MSTEHSGAVEALLSRRSVPALQLSEPGPTAEQIATAIDAALCAPDHGALKPLRMVLIQGEARARLSELLTRRMAERDPPAPPGKVDKTRRMLSSAPLVIAVGARVAEAPKVPELEQLFSAAAGIMNLLNAFHAMGYGAIWLTGPNAYDPEVAQSLRFAADERGLGFVYVGTVASSNKSPAPRQREHAGAVRDWTG
jgi:nitroreductase